MESPDLVSQTAQFLHDRREDQKERNREGRAFRIGMATLATVVGAKSFFGRRGA